MGNAGFQGTMAGTALRGAITRLLNPTAEAGDILADMGVKVLDAEGNMRPLVDIVGELEAGGLTAGDAMTLFGQRAGPAMLALISQGSGALQELKTEMDNSGGTAESIADTQLNTLSGDITLLKSAFEGLALTIGAVIVPELRKIMLHLTPIIQAVGDWTNKNPELTQKLVLLAVAVAAILLVFGGLIIAAGFLATGLAVLASGPVLLAIAGFGALVVAVGGAIWKWEELDQFVKTWKTMLPQDVYEAFEGVTAPLEVFYGTLDVLEGRLADIAASMILKLPQDVYEAFEGVNTPLETFYGTLDVLEGRLADIAAPMILKLPQDVYEAFEGVTTPLEVFYGTLDVLEGRLADIAAPMILKLPQDVYEAFEGVKTPLEAFYGVLDVLEGRLAVVMQPFIDSINLHLAPALQTVRDRIDGVKTSIEEILEPYLTPMRDKFQAISEKLQPIVGFLKDAEGLMYALGAAIFVALLPISGPVGLLFKLGQLAIKFVDIEKVIDTQLKPALKWFTENIMPKIKEVWENTVKPALEAFWEWLHNKLVAAWENNLKPALEAMVAFFETTLPAAMKWVTDAFTEIKESMDGHVDDTLPKMNEANDDQEKRWGRLGDAITEAISEMWENVQPLWDELVETWEKTIKPMLEAMQALWEFVWDAIDQYVIAITESIIVVMETFFSVFVAALEVFLNLIQGDWDEAWEAKKKFFDEIFEGITGIFDAWKAAFSEAWEELLAQVKLVWETAWTEVSTKVSEIWETIKTNTWQFVLDLVAYIAELPGLIVEAIKDIPGKFGETFEKSFDKVKGWIARGSMVEYIKTLGEQIGLAIDDVPGVFDATFSDAAAGVEDRVAAMAADVAASAASASAALAGIGSGGGGGGGGGGSGVGDIPPLPQHILDMLAEQGITPPGVGNPRSRTATLAAGGIVTSPTLALMGERGPEAVIPLNKLGGMGGGGTQIHVHAENFYGYSDFIDAVQQAGLEGDRLGIGLGAA